ncbi:hypothetical protein BDR07DRAFT_1426278 [Suillus spraguei]|nr:hypothetical protein BDR07DRAFT_1426278 [Suillus spraguei]
MTITNCGRTVYRWFCMVRVSGYYVFTVRASGYSRAHHIHPKVQCWRFGTPMELCGASKSKRSQIQVEVHSHQRVGPCYGMLRSTL